MLNLLYEAERSWWYRGRAAVVSSVLGRFEKGARVGSTLDFGAGFGGMLDTLKQFSREVKAFEPDTLTHKALFERGYTKIFNTPDEALAESYDLIALFDVLEHIEDDQVFLIRVQQALASDGRLLITVPAYQWLWSEHDTANHHFKRYTKSSLVQTLATAGYQIEYAGYWNMFAFIPAALTRLIGLSGGDALLLPKPLNAILLFFVRVEAFCVRFVSLPFGLSVIVYATKKD